MKRPLLLLFFLLAGAQLFAQDEPVAEADSAEVTEYEYDSTWVAGEYQDEYSESESGNSIVNPKDTKAAAAYMNEEQSLKKFDDKDWKAIVGDFTYEEKPPKPEPKKKEEEPKKPWFNMPSINPQVLRVVSFVLIFLILAAILYYVSRNATFGQSIKKMKQVDIAAPVENIEEVDIDGLLKKALADGDLRAAIRVHYLMLLKKLNEVGLIVWKKDKTNRDYLSELYGRNDCYDDVRKLTVAYELVWYGERSVSPDSFQRMTGEFESVNRQVAKDKTEA